MMNLDIKTIKNQINIFYDIEIINIKHIRSMIGHVYSIENEKQKFILKLNRPQNKKSSVQATEIIDFLYQNNYPVVNLLKTKYNDNYFEYKAEHETYIGFIYDYVEGVEPNIEKEITKIGQQIGLFHKLMENYPKPIIKRGKEFYVDRFVNILFESNYDKNKIENLNNYGKELWKNLEKSTKGICHGDLHSGNMFQKNGKYILFDFDTLSYTFPIIDIATLCDTTNFNNLKEKDFDKIMSRFQNFYKGYTVERTIEDTDIKNIFNFIPIRHFELIATITINQKSNLKKAFLDQQYEWIMKWKRLCDKKI